jgi:hypothetical protein
MHAEPALGDDEQQGGFGEHRRRGRDRGAMEAEVRDQQQAQREIDRKGRAVDSDRLISQIFR